MSCLMDHFLVPIFILSILLTLMFSVGWLLGELLPSCFRCNEIVSGSVSSIYHLPTHDLQPPLCDVRVQTTWWNDTISSIQCASVARCDLNLSACVNVQISVNHYNRGRCMYLVLGPGDLLDSTTLPYESIDWWWQLVQHALEGLLLLLAAVAAIAIGVKLYQLMLDAYDSGAFKPWFSPARTPAYIDTELAVEKTSLVNGPGLRHDLHDH